MGRMGCASCMVWRAAFLGRQTLTPKIRARFGWRRRPPTYDYACGWTFVRDAAPWIGIGAALISACTGLYAAAGNDLHGKVERFIPLIRGQSPWAGEQRPIESRVLVGLCHSLNMGWVKHRTGANDRLRELLLEI